jgi:hypothetical protein
MAVPDAPIPAAPKPNRSLPGRIGFVFSLVPWLVILLFLYIQPG